MPTGYTADIAKGITFEQYALNCARAFGALILMRDDPSSTPIPERFEPSDYHIKAMASAKEDLARYDAMSRDDANAAAVEDYLAEVDRHEKRITEATELRNKYNAMLAQVVQWQPPTADHVKYKEFMIEQLRSSIDFDCNTDYYTKPERLTGSEWLAQRITKARESVAYHEREHAQEVERTENRNGWIKALRDSLLK
jgi:hypothetical protein